jgi:Fe-S-cluster-containing dehydrogenase component/DMSO reductase anchor subunit
MEDWGMTACTKNNELRRSDAPPGENVPKNVPTIVGTLDDSAASPTDLLARLLREQSQLTAVERFAGLHEAGELPLQAKHYRALLPAAPPGPGQQYAFDVDLDRCSGCKACVTACHSLNGLDEVETWRDVGLLIGGTSSLPVLQHVTTACHHCLQPACMSACPVNAYEKDPHTGIVKHLDDQCFGCQYCTLACPYDVPKYHHAKGIVRKCDMCSSRLAVGEAPACVQACPHQAIRIQVVDVQQVVENAEVASFLPAAPDPLFTLPTTTYRTTRSFPRNTLPADYYDVNPQHAHLPLVIMLVLTQLSVGAFAVGLLLESLLPPGAWAAMRPTFAASALTFGLLALGASTLHLGRPQFAFRAVLGLAHSWLSREIVMFGIFAALACTYAGVAMFFPTTNSELLRWLAWLVAISGLAGVGCSVMIYVFTQREFWSPLQTGVKFLLTSAMLGLAAVWLTMLLLSLGSTTSGFTAEWADAGRLCAKLLIGVTIAKLMWEAALFTHLANARMTSLKRSALLMFGPLSSTTFARFASGVLGGMVMPAFLLQRAEAHGPSLPLLISALVLVMACVAGELLERYLFFAAVAVPRMPGGIR